MRIEDRVPAWPLSQLEVHTMKIKEYCEGWPPIITIGAGRDFPGSELADVVVSLRKYAEAKDRIILETRDKNGIAYGIPVSLPENVLDRAIAALSQKLPLTVGEVGEVNV